MKIIFLALCALSLELKAAIPTLEKNNYGAHLATAEDRKMPMSVRWQALVKAAESADYKQMLEIKKFAQSKEWYMRNAALVALEKININQAIDEARILLTDKALVVRSAAVDVLSRRYTRENRDLLVAELSKPYNYSKKQSLWIRAKIFETVAAKASSEDRSFFTKYLFDSDEKIVNRAVATLEKLTDVRFEGKNQVQEWRTHVKKNGWL